MLKQYLLKRSVIVEDRHNQETPRFKIVTSKAKKVPHYHYLKFKKGDIYFGASRTELGMFLLENMLLTERKKND